MAWMISNSYPYQDTLGKLVPVISSPLPEGVFNQHIDEYPKLSYLNSVDIISDPLPMGVFIQYTGEYPKFAHLKLINTGAFANASSLKKVSIPRSVKQIGKTSFRNTQIKEVIIAKDCVYYPTSFPDDCKINFYED